MLTHTRARLDHGAGVLLWSIISDQRSVGIDQWPVLPKLHTPLR